MRCGGGSRNATALVSAFVENVPGSSENTSSAATAAFEEASAHVDEAQASVTSAVETHELKLEEHRVLMEQWDEGDDTDDGPGPGPDYELVVTAIDALNSAKAGRTAARRAVATAPKQRAAPVAYKHPTLPTKE